MKKLAAEVKKIIGSLGIESACDIVTHLSKDDSYYIAAGIYNGTNKASKKTDAQLISEFEALLNSGMPDALAYLRPYTQQSDFPECIEEIIAEFPPTFLEPGTDWSTAFLFIAALNGGVNVIKALIKLGIDPMASETLSDGTVVTAVKIAHANGQTSVLNFLKEVRARQ